MRTKSSLLSQGGEAGSRQGQASRSNRGTGSVLMEQDSGALLPDSQQPPPLPSCVNCTRSLIFTSVNRMLTTPTSLGVGRIKRVHTRNTLEHAWHTASPCSPHHIPEWQLLTQSQELHCASAIPHNPEVPREVQPPPPVARSFYHPQQMFASPTCNVLQAELISPLPKPTRAGSPCLRAPGLGRG